MAVTTAYVGGTVTEKFGPRKYWSDENIGLGDQNSRNNGPPGPFSPEKFGPDVE